MSNEPSYSGSSVYFMNTNDVWSYSIQNASQLDSKQSYRLHATGYADLSGRKYVALPKNMVLTPEIKKQYNLL